MGTTSDQNNCELSRLSSDRLSLNKKNENTLSDNKEESLIKRLNNIEHRKSSFASRFDSERSSLRGRNTSKDTSKILNDSLSKKNYESTEGEGTFASRFNEERISQRLRERSGRSSPDQESEPRYQAFF